MHENLKGPSFELHTALRREDSARQTANREFLLRRITTLSLYTFGLLALLRQTDIKRQAGSLEAEDLHILRYFTAEAKQARKNNSRLFDSRKQRANSAVFREFSKSQAQAGEEASPGGRAE